MARWLSNEIWIKIIPTKIANTIANTACKITDEENIAIAHEINKTQALKKQIEEQNKKMQNLANEMRALIKERKDLDKADNYLQNLMENKDYLQALINGQGTCINETNFPTDACLTQ